MPRINSRSKGNRFERSIAKWFQDWTGYEFGRVPGSGSLRWKKTDNITGDLACTDDKHSRRFPFTIECKNYQEIKFEHILLGNKTCKILSFWEQASNDAARANKVPILIMRYNQMPSDEGFFAVTEPLAKAIISLGPKKPYMKIVSGDVIFTVFMLSDIKEFPYIDLYKVARKEIKK